MPVLNIQTNANTSQEKSLLKMINLIGSDPGADIRLIDHRVPRVAAQIHRSKSGWTLSAVGTDFPVCVNDKPITKHTLLDQDTITIGAHKIQFLEHPRATLEQHQSRELEAYARLAAFVNRLSSETHIPKLLEVLIDEIVALTKAERAFLVLLENNVPRVEVARNMHGETLNRAVSQMSDTILNSVLSSKTACVVSNALNNQEFNASASVINFKLTSVMCTPLLSHGQLLGAIYVGNNGVVNAFDDESLKILSVFAGQASLMVKNAMLINDLTQETQDLRVRLEQARFGNLIGNCTPMQDIYKKIEKAAKAQTNVLFLGETGTGKELLARELHSRSERHGGAFVVVNCGAIPESLLESELFGHVRGAFMGATTTQIGRFQAAHQGTLFLDEISEVPLYLQAKLLRALTEKCVSKLGDSRTETADVRLIAASSKKLLPLLESGLLREDLHYSLNALPLALPPLRERGNDVILIANFFLQKHTRIVGKTIRGFTEAAQNALLNYSWPGNVRELENVVCRAVVFCDNDRLDVDDLDVVVASRGEITSLAEAVEHFRNEYIAQSLERNAGNRTRAAKELGVDPRTIFRYLEDIRNADGRTQVTCIE